MEIPMLRRFRVFVLLLLSVCSYWLTPAWSADPKTDDLWLCQTGLANLQLSAEARVKLQSQCKTSQAAGQLNAQALIVSTSTAIVAGCENSKAHAANSIYAQSDVFKCVSQSVSNSISKAPRPTFDATDDDGCDILLSRSEGPKDAKAVQRCSQQQSKRQAKLDARLAIAKQTAHDVCNRAPGKGQFEDIAKCLNTELADEAKYPRVPPSKGTFSPMIKP